MSLVETGGRAAGEIVHFGEENRKAAADGVAGDAAAVDAAADDEDVIDRGCVQSFLPRFRTAAFLLFIESVTGLFRNK